MIDVTFTDFDEFSTIVKDVDCSMMMHHNPESYEWKIKQISFNNIDIQMGLLGSGNLLEGETKRDGFIFYSPLSKSAEYIVNGKTIEKGSISIFEPGSDFTLSTVEAHDWCTIFLPTEILVNDYLHNERLAQLTVGDAEPAAYVTSPNKILTDRIQRIVSATLNTAKAYNGQLENSPASASIIEEMMDIGKYALNIKDLNEDQNIGRKKYSRRKLIKDVIEFLESHSTSKHTVDYLAQHLKISARTLHNIFHEYYGVGPKYYISLRQKYRVHYALRAADAHRTNVTNILIDNGVWEHGRFAKEYKLLFGEYPSETINRT